MHRPTSPSDDRLLALDNWGYRALMHAPRFSFYGIGLVFLVACASEEATRPPPATGGFAGTSATAGATGRSGTAGASATAGSAGGTPSGGTGQGATAGATGGSAGSTLGGAGGTDVLGSGGSTVTTGGSGGGAGLAGGGSSAGGGAAGKGGTPAGTGGSTAGNGGTTAGTGGSTAGTGGTTAGTGGTGGGGAATICATCAEYTKAGNLASVTVTTPALTELSGIAASRKHPGVLYAHNDSGDSARFFALSPTGELLATFVLAGVTAVDWEDAAVGPCDAGTCLFIGDIGDNAVKRKDYRLLKVPEPELPAVVGATVGAPHERVDFSYADGKSYNCETLMLHPVTGDAYLVTKAAGASVPVFRIEAKALVPAVPAMAIKVADLALGGEVATGGDIHPCGDRLLLRTYGGVRELRADGAFETAFAASPKMLAIPPNEVQGEAIAYLANGLGYVTASEATPPFPMQFAGCQ